MICHGDLCCLCRSMVGIVVTRYLGRSKRLKKFQGQDSNKKQGSYHNTLLPKQDLLQNSWLFASPASKGKYRKWMETTSLYQS